jgi:hypothetical protein
MFKRLQSRNNDQFIRCQQIAHYASAIFNTIDVNDAKVLNRMKEKEEENIVFFFL